VRSAVGRAGNPGVAAQQPFEAAWADAVGGRRRRLPALCAPSGARFDAAAPRAAPVDAPAAPLLNALAHGTSVAENGDIVQGIDLGRKPA
jgi:hypothetical protein